MKKYITIFSVMAGLIALFFLITFLIQVGYLYQWTGFGTFLGPNQEFQRAKTLWDWLELLIIPTVLALSALFFSAVQRKNDWKIENDRVQEATLQSYMDRMSELLIDKDLRQSEPKSEKQIVARSWTLTTLRRLNPERKGILLKFLHESNLIQNENHQGTISLQQADLSDSELNGAELSGINLYNTYLACAKLQTACLKKADLGRVNLQKADLRGSDLQEANMYLANLAGADLSDANLVGADLENVNFERVKYNKNTKWPKGFNLENKRIGKEFASS